MIIITNNVKVMKETSNSLEKEYIDGSHKDVLIAVRDRIHKGHRLLTHPLSGSIKPNETPFKSVAISKVPGELDLESLDIIEKSIRTYEKFSKIPTTYGNTNKERILKDYSEIDYSILENALISANRR